MRTSKHTLRLFLTLLGVTLIASPAKAALTLTIDTFTSTTFSYSLSGTIDDDTTGAWVPGVVVVALEESVSTPFYSGTPTVVTNTITIGGIATNSTMANNGSTTGFSSNLARFTTTSAIAAGTEVVGTITYTGSFSPGSIVSSDFELWTGYDAERDLARFEGNAIPEPHSLCLISLAAVALIRTRSRN